MESRARKLFVAGGVGRDEFLRSVSCAILDADLRRPRLWVLGVDPLLAQALRHQQRTILVGRGYVLGWFLDGRVLRAGRLRRVDLRVGAGGGRDLLPAGVVGNVDAVLPQALDEMLHAVY